MARTLPWLAALAFLVATPAHAATVGFTLDVTDTLVLRNDSDAFAITGYRLTIGDTSFDYDAVVASFSVGSPGSSFALIQPDALDGGLRSDVLEFGFTNFLPGDVFDVIPDIDPDTGDASCCNPSGVLFNNGSDSRAALSVTFSNGFVLDYVLTDTQPAPDPDGTGCATPGVCSFSASFDLPEPGVATLFAAAAFALALRRRRVMR